MSLQQRPKPAHAIDRNNVEAVASETDISATRLTECLNLFQAVVATEFDPEEFLSSCPRPNQVLATDDGRTYAYVTPLVWRDLHAHIEFTNTEDQAVAAAHRRQLEADCEGVTQLSSIYKAAHHAVVTYHQE